MATQTPVSQMSEASTQASSFERFAGLCAILVGITGLLYAISFVILRSTLLSSLFLMLIGLFYLPTLTVLYTRLRETDTAFPLWAFLLSAAGAFGALIHGGYDLANTLHPVTNNPDIASLPNAIDPRGLLTFGIAGLGLFTISWLIGHNGQFSRALSYLGYLAAALLVILYVGRLLIFTPTSPLILYPVLLSGFLVNPAWYIWLGLALWRGRK